MDCHAVCNPNPTLHSLHWQEAIAHMGLLLSSVSYLARGLQDRSNETHYVELAVEAWPAACAKSAILIHLILQALNRRETSLQEGETAVDRTLFDASIGELETLPRRPQR